MKGIMGVWLVGGLATSSVLAGTVVFDPPVATVEAGVPAEFRVTIASTDLVQFDSVDILLSSDTAGLSLSFVYDPSFETSLASPEPTPLGRFPSDLYVGGVNFDLWQTPVVVGTLRIDTAGLASGTYAGIIAVRPTDESETTGNAISVIGLASARTLEELSGSADLVIAGEPVDSDGDGVTDDMDAFPDDAGETKDTDGDGTGDNADAFPEDPAESVDTDGDGTGNFADPDDDGDEVPDMLDDFPLDPAETTDSDGDGVGDNADAFPDDPGQTVNPGTPDGGSDVADDGSDSDGAGRFCGMGMLGGFVSVLLGMTATRLRRRTARAPHRTPPSWRAF